VSERDLAIREAIQRVRIIRHTLYRQGEITMSGLRRLDEALGLSEDETYRLTGEKMSERAERFAEYMEKKHEWQCGEKECECLGCGKRAQDPVNFCSHCGSRMTLPGRSESTLREIEDGLQYALGEKGE